MRTKLVHILLLLALTFNIAHASIIAAEDHCSHETVSEYVNEQGHSTDCGDLCDIHHLFHLIAIITTDTDFIHAPMHTEQPDSKLLAYHPPFQETENKPPIA